MKAICHSVVCGAFAALLFSCSGAGEEGGGDLRTVTLSEQSITMKAGESRYLRADVSDGAEVVWNSSDWDAVSVSGGRLTANTYGMATITATSGRARASCEVLVPLATVTPSFARLEAGQQLRLTTESIPAGLEFSWSSTDEQVLSVSADGIVTAKGNGVAMAVASSGEISANCAVYVGPSDTHFVFIDRCESLGENGGTWQSDAGSPVLDGTSPREGFYCVSRDFAGSAVTFFKKTFGTPVNASEFDASKAVFSFDLYISRAEALRLDEGDAQIELSSSPTLDEDEFHWMFRNSLGLKDGWNHIVLPLKDAGTDGTPDLSRLCRIRIYSTASNAAAVLKIDNFILYEE
ncbi:MAG: Ig-like domain-containing protein [Bacteroidales bacterium]|nr:Ig-like domain-containing protein [Bacteroidales bacterium]